MQSVHYESFWMMKENIQINNKLLENFIQIFQKREQIQIFVCDHLQVIYNEAMAISEKLSQSSNQFERVFIKQMIHSLQEQCKLNRQYLHQNKLTKNIGLYWKRGIQDEKNILNEYNMNRQQNLRRQYELTNKIQQLNLISKKDTNLLNNFLMEIIKDNCKKNQIVEVIKRFQDNRNQIEKYVGQYYEIQGKVISSYKVFIDRIKGKLELKQRILMDLLNEYNKYLHKKYPQYKQYILQLPISLQISYKDNLNNNWIQFEIPKINGYLIRMLIKFDEIKSQFIPHEMSRQEYSIRLNQLYQQDNSKQFSFCNPDKMPYNSKLNQLVKIIHHFGLRLRHFKQYPYQILKHFKCLIKNNRILRETFINFIYNAHYQNLCFQISSIQEQNFICLFFQEFLNVCEEQFDVLNSFNVLMFWEFYWHNVHNQNRIPLRSIFKHRVFRDENYWTGLYWMKLYKKILEIKKKEKSLNKKVTKSALVENKIKKKSSFLEYFRINIHKQQNNSVLYVDSEDNDRWLRQKQQCLQEVIMHMRLFPQNRGKIKKFIEKFQEITNKDQLFQKCKQEEVDNQLFYEDSFHNIDRLSSSDIFGSIIE